MPSTGFYLFLLSENQGCIRSRSIVSMPSTGFYLFLPDADWAAPIWTDDVSMPSTGFYLFLQLAIGTVTDNLLCQCPQRASTYFFRYQR